MPTGDTPAHRQHVVNAYDIMYPDHAPRAGDPNYRDFEAYRRRTKGDPDVYKCAWGVEVDDFTQCSPPPLELHHAHIEFALQNGVDLAHLEHAYPGVSDPKTVGAWVESAENLVWLCARHHRAQSAGVHHLAAADYEASKWLQSGIIVPKG